MKISGEQIGMSITVLLLGAVVLAQTFLLRPDTRSVFTDADRYEGVPVLTVSEKRAQLTLETDRPEPGVFVLINGKKQQSFYNKKITICVQEHSLIQIEKEGVSHAVTVAVTGISDFVKRQNLNLKVEGDAPYFCIGRILFQ